MKKMVFNTNWEPNDALGEIVKIARNHGGEMCNINDRVGDPIPDGRGGWVVPAESTTGHFHDTGGKYHIQKDPVKGSIVSYIPDHKTSSQEAQNIEEKTKYYYFNNY